MKKKKTFFFFHFRVPVTSVEPKLRKNDKNAKGKPAFLSFKKKMYLCTILNMMIMPNKNIFVGFGLRSEFVSLIYLFYPQISELLESHICPTLSGKYVSSSISATITNNEFVA